MHPIFSASSICLFASSFLHANNDNNSNNNNNDVYILLFYFALPLPEYFFCTGRKVQPTFMEAHAFLLTLIRFLDSAHFVSYVCGGILSRCNNAVR